MKKIYIIGSSSQVSDALDRYSSEECTLVFLGRSNPFQLKNYIQYSGIEDEQSVEQLSATIIRDMKMSEQLESASLVILSGISSSDWRTSFLVNEYLPAVLSEQFAQHISLLQLKDCSITLIGSSAAYQGAKLSYATTKASLTGIVHAISRDYRGKARINMVLPSAFNSGMIADWDDEKREAVAGANHIGRLGSAEDVADAIMFTVNNKFITNSVLNLTGGTVHI